MALLKDSLIAHYKMNENTANDNDELVTNGTFDSDIDGWVSGNLETFEWDAGELHIVETGTSYSYARQVVELVVGKRYKYSFDITKNSNVVDLIFKQGANPIVTCTETRSYSGVFICLDTLGIYFLVNGGAGDWNIDNVSIRLCAVEDSSGNDHDGLLQEDTSVAHVAGKINGAFDFDGSSDYIEIADHVDFNVGTGDISVFVWVNSDDDSAYQVIVSKDNYIDDISFRLMGDNKLQIYIDNVNLISAVAVGINAWHFVGFTRKLGTTKLYIDGVERGSSASLTGSIDNAHNVCIGIRGNGLALPFSGLIDNVMFFNKELTPLEVKYLYNSGAGIESIPTLIELSRTGQHFSSHQEN